MTPATQLTADMYPGGYTARFEVVGDLYYRTTGHMRPGKDSVTEDTSSPENRERFELYVSTQLLRDALNEIVRLQHKVEALEKDAEWND